MTKTFSTRTTRSSGLFRRGVVISLTTALLSGCVVGPDYKGPTFLSSITSIKAASQARPLPDVMQWWKRFNDPVLDSIVNQAMAQNLSVASAKAKVREARASYRATGASDLPAANGSSLARRSGFIDGPAGNQFQAGLDASWEIDLFGANQRTQEAARAGLDAAQEELRGATVTLIADVATNYINARGYQERISLSNKTVASQRQTRELIQTRLDLGSANLLDVANAEGQVASTETSIPDLQIGYEQAVHRLGILTGQEPKALASLLGKRKPVPQATVSPRKGIAADAISARPDVRVAERNLARATANIGVAEAARYPSVSLTGSISSSAASIGDLAKASTISWALGPSISVPIFNNGRLESNVDAARAQRDQSFLAYQASVLGGLEDVENALVSMTQNRIKRSKIQASTAAYQKSFDLTRSSYENGASDLLDVLSAERSLFSAQTNAIENRVAMALDFVTLNKALGGGWDGALDVSKPIVSDGKVGPRLASK
jgi:NodT family efflux transporter outer membrane factor (OMF) lipoprotein